MKRKFEFPLKKEQRRGAGNAIAALVMALAMAVSGIGATTLLASQPEALVVAPTTLESRPASGERSKRTAPRGAAPEQEAESLAESESEAESDAVAEPEQETESSAAGESTAEHRPADEPADTQPEAGQQPAEEAQPAAAAPQPEQAESVVEIEDENSFATFRQETPELAAEDPLSASAAQNSDIAEKLSRAMEETSVFTLTPEQIQQALDEGALDEWTGDIESENCLKWLWQWITGSLFKKDGYSGWRTSGGKTYYYDESTHEKFTGIHSIDGKLYYFNENGVMQDDVTFGIDVSKYQSSINWSKVKSSGVQFAIVRLGYRGYVTGTLVEDPMFESHFTGARDAGLKVGVYIFSQAVNENEAREEAIATAYVLNGRSVDYPVYFDSEASGASDGSGRADGLGKEDRTKCAIAFCEEIKAQGYEAGVYASTRWFEKRLDLSKLKAYSIWNAHYDVVSSSIDCDIWQGTYRGKVNGYSGNIDINISYIG